MTAAPMTTTKDNSGSGNHLANSIKHEEEGEEEDVCTPGRRPTSRISSRKRRALTTRPRRRVSSSSSSMTTTVRTETESESESKESVSKGPYRYPRFRTKRVNALHANHKLAATNTENSNTTSTTTTSTTSTSTLEDSEDVQVSKRSLIYEKAMQRLMRNFMVERYSPDVSTTTTSMTTSTTTTNKDHFLSFKADESLLLNKYIADLGQMADNMEQTRESTPPPTTTTTKMDDVGT